MPYLVVGGVWDRKCGRPSKIAAEIADHLTANLLNGGHTDDLAKVDIKQYSLVVWLADVPNEEAKVYPQKATGATLIVSKVMREGYTSVDAAKKIFEMHGNAVIEIHRDGEKLSFRLADALGNEWCKTNEIRHVCNNILSLYDWTQGSIRVKTISESTVVPPVPDEMGQLIEIVRLIADKVEIKMGERYFGNLSTRCMKTFPSMRTGRLAAFVSPRNIDKRRIEIGDMVYTWTDEGNNDVLFAGERKPSVDTATQMLLYRKFDWLRFMVHGHAYVDHCSLTRHYVPCGDLREVDEIAELIKHTEYAREGIVNLRNHGFLMYASHIEKLEQLAHTAVFVNRF